MYFESSNQKRNITLNQCITYNVCVYYIQEFSENYDVLSGRDYLAACQATINYKDEVVILSDYSFIIRYNHKNFIKDKNSSNS